MEDTSAPHQAMTAFRERTSQALILDWTSATIVLPEYFKKNGRDHFSFESDQHGRILLPMDGLGGFSFQLPLPSLDGYHIQFRFRADLDYGKENVRGLRLTDGCEEELWKLIHADFCTPEQGQDALTLIKAINARGANPETNACQASNDHIFMTNDCGRFGVADYSKCDRRFERLTKHSHLSSIANDYENIPRGMLSPLGQELQDISAYVELGGPGTCNSIGGTSLVDALKRTLRLYTLHMDIYRALGGTEE